MMHLHHWGASLVLHVAAAALFLGNIERTDSDSVSVATVERIRISMANEPPPLPASSSRTPPQAESSESDSRRRTYKAIAGDLRGDPEASSGPASNPGPQLDHHPQPSISDMDQPRAVQPKPAEPEGVVQTSVPLSEAPPTREQQPTGYGNSSFSQNDGERIPGFIVSNLDAQTLLALVREGHLLLVATMGERNIRFMGPPTSPTAALIGDQLAGYSQRGILPSDQVRDAAWRVLAREFGFRETQRGGAQIAFVLSQQLDEVIISAQRDAAMRLQTPPHDLRVTHGRLIRSDDGYQFMIDRVE